MTCRVGHSAAIRTSYWKIDRPAPRECPRPGVTGGASCRPTARKHWHTQAKNERAATRPRSNDRGVFPANDPASSNPNRDDQSALEPQRPRDRMTRRRSGNAVL